MCFNEFLNVAFPRPQGILDFCEIRSFTLHMFCIGLHFVVRLHSVISISLTSKDVKVIGQVVHLLNLQGFLETFNKRSVAGEGFGLVTFCFLMWSLDCRDEEMRTFYQYMLPG